jgi:hypothetical protein
LRLPGFFRHGTGAVGYGQVMEDDVLPDTLTRVLVALALNRGAEWDPSIAIVEEALDRWVPEQPPSWAAIEKVVAQVIAQAEVAGAHDERAEPQR